MKNSYILFSILYFKLIGNTFISIYLKTKIQSKFNTKKYIINQSRLCAMTIIYVS